MRFVCCHHVKLLLLLLSVADADYVEYTYDIISLFQFSRPVLEPATSGVEDVVRLAQEFYQDKYCQMYPWTCIHAEAAIYSPGTKWNSSPTLGANFISISYTLKVSFMPDGSEPDAEQARKTAEIQGEDKALYLKNFVNVIDTAISSNFAL